MVARILDVMNIVPLQRQLKISEDFENYVECRRSKQIKGRFGNAEELASSPLQLCESALSCVHKCSFSFQPVLLLVGRFTRVPMKNENAFHPA